MLVLWEVNLHDMLALIIWEKKNITNLLYAEFPYYKLSVKD